MSWQQSANGGQYGASSAGAGGKYEQTSASSSDPRSYQAAYYGSQATSADQYGQQGGYGGYGSAYGHQDPLSSHRASFGLGAPGSPATRSAHEASVDGGSGYDHANSPNRGAVAGGGAAGTGRLPAGYGSQTGGDQYSSYYSQYGQQQGAGAAGGKQQQAYSAGGYGQPAAASGAAGSAGAGGRNVSGGSQALTGSGAYQTLGSQPQSAPAYQSSYSAYPGYGAQQQSGQGQGQGYYPYQQQQQQQAGYYAGQHQGYGGHAATTAATAAAAGQSWNAAAAYDPTSLSAYQQQYSRSAMPHVQPSALKADPSAAGGAITGTTPAQLVAQLAAGGKGNPAVVAAAAGAYGGLGKRGAGQDFAVAGGETKGKKAKASKKENQPPPPPKEPPAPKKSHLKPPRQAHSAWQIFFTDQLNEAKAKTQPGEKLNVAHIAKEAGTAYANLDAEQKKLYGEKAKIAREEYQKELAKWQLTLTPEDVRQENAFRASQRKAGKSRKGNLKDPNAPRKPLSAYFLFLKAIRASAELTKAVFEGESETTKQSMLAAKRWRGFSDEQKKPYLKQAEADKAEYERLRKEYEEHAAAMARGENPPELHQTIPSYARDEVSPRLLAAVLPTMGLDASNIAPPASTSGGDAGASGGGVKHEDFEEEDESGDEESGEEHGARGTSADDAAAVANAITGGQGFDFNASV